MTMQKEMIRLSRPQIPEIALQQVLDVLDSGMLVQGKWVRRFEQELEAYLDIENCILVSNGTAALHLTLLAAGIGSGDEVIVPAYTFTAVANAVELTGARPIFADIQLSDCCIDTLCLSALITPATKAIIAVHEFGLMADLDKIIELAQLHNLLVIEDAACALGATLHNKKAGTFTYTGCFSFHPRKILTTGEGGAIVTKDAKLANHLRNMRNHGIENNHGKIDFVCAGYNYRMTEFQAALGPSQLDTLDETIIEHRRQATIYQTLLSGITGLHLPRPLKDSEATYQTFHLLFDQASKRDGVKSALLAEGIESNIGAYAIPHLSYYKEKYSTDDNAFPAAQAAFQRGLAIPLGVHLQNEDLSHISSIIQKAMTDEPS